MKTDDKENGGKMSIYTKEEWLEKCDTDAIVQSMLMPSKTENEAMRRRLSMDNSIGYMRNKLFTDGIYEVIEDV